MNGEDAWFSALSWSSGRFVNHNSAIVLRVKGYQWIGNVVAPIWWADIGASWISESSGFASTGDAESFVGERASLMKWALTASMFVEQELLGHEAVRVGKHVASRIVEPHETTCNVVVLRRQSDRHRADAEGGPVEWSHQWIVRGHWRKQFYPKAGRNVPIFIAPYIKGPADKPMKAPNPTVFSVER